MAAVARSPFSLPIVQLPAAASRPPAASQAIGYAEPGHGDQSLGIRRLRAGQRIVAGVITDDHGRAPLIQRADNHRWEPPGGVLELGETITHGLRREVREETGLDVEPVALTRVYKNMTRGIVALVFRCKITGGDLATTDEASAFRWAAGTEVPDLTEEAYAVRVLDALSGDHPPAVRHHDGVHLL